VVATSPFIEITGWLVSIAYIDPGNYQADIQAGATTQYYLLFTIWWTSILSIYVQVLCVRLGYRTQKTLAEVQAKEFRQQRSNMKRYFAWFVAEFSVIITDLPEVIGIGIACNLFFGWPYWIGVLMSLLTTMSFLATMQFGMQILEGIIVGFVGIMSIALFVEMSFVGADTESIVKGWVYGFIDIGSDDLFAIAGIIGAVVMPHNLYLHTASVQSRKVVRRPEVVEQAVWYCSLEPIIPIFISFFVNLAVVAIAAERVYGSDNAAMVGLTDFCGYFLSLKGGCFLWGIALLAAGQSSAITTTYTGQYIMDGFLELRLPIKVRAVATRLVAITPCVVVSVFFPKGLNLMINVVNAALGFLLPFALLPLIKYNCSPIIMGDNASKGPEKAILYGFGVFVWLINAMTLSVPGGGFFGDFVNTTMDWSATKVVWIVIQVLLQVLYAWWCCICLFTPLENYVEVEGEDSLPPRDGQQVFVAPPDDSELT
jgi:NRAMP (natural resistance-associated macrophage protein)-like metal ion transporter